jgi:cytochrome c biogenesis protein CcmG, thiol:disulfide interchange protein DsbE
MIWKRLLYILPALAFAALAYAMYASLNAPAPGDIPLPSMLVDKPAPNFALPALDAKAQGFGRADLATGQVVVVNVFASWCVPCRAEAPALAQLTTLKGVALYGMVWKDDAVKARAFLEEVGDPYARIDLDADGRTGIDWGVYGVPETFVIDGHGIVKLRYPGPLVGDALAKIVMPAIEAARKD